MKRIISMVLVLLLALSGCGLRQPGESLPTEGTEAPAVKPTEAPTTVPAEEPTTEPTEPPTEPDPVQALLQSMTLEQKVGQLFVARCPSENAAEDAAAYQLGGYILFGRDFANKTAQEILETVTGYQQGVQIPMLMGVDEEGGTVVRASAQFALREEPFQSPQRVYAEGGMEGILEDTRQKDALLRSLGIHVNFAPVADVSTDPEDFIYDRSFGQDAQATADYVAQVIAQMSLDGMGSVLKHFPGYGSNVDTHNGIAVDPRPLETFETQDLLPFRSWPHGQGLTAIMVSHNIITCLDEELPASLSATVIDYLRRSLDYNGVVMTDALDMGAVKAYSQDGDIAVTALLAGVDVLLVCDYKTGIPAILEAVEAGTVTEARIDEACLRILTWKQGLGLL